MFCEANFSKHCLYKNKDFFPKTKSAAGLSKQIFLVSVHHGNDGESLSNTNMVIL